MLNEFQLKGSFTMKGGGGIAKKLLCNEPIGTVSTQLDYSTVNLWCDSMYECSRVYNV